MFHSNDLTVLTQHTNKSECVCVPTGRGDSFERCVSEAELLLDQSVRLEKAGDITAALSAVSEAECKISVTPPPHAHTHPHIISTVKVSLNLLVLAFFGAFPSFNSTLSAVKLL